MWMPIDMLDQMEFSAERSGLQHRRSDDRMTLEIGLVSGPFEEAHFASVSVADDGRGLVVTDTARPDDPLTIKPHQFPVIGSIIALLGQMKVLQQTLATLPPTNGPAGPSRPDYRHN